MHKIVQPNTYGIKRCPYCNSTARRAGNYRVFETKNFYIMKCCKCGKGQIILKKAPNEIKCPECKNKVNLRKYGK